MPEGDTVHGLAARLRATLVGASLVSADARRPAVVAGLVGRVASDARARGKHLLLWFPPDVVLRVHLGIDGSWRITAPGAPPHGPPDAWAMTLRTEIAAHHLSAPRALERLAPADLADHPLLAALGPDLALPDPDLDEVLRRARAPERAAWPVQDLLLCQEVAAGIGNVYKSEVLFLEGLDPTTPVAAVDDARLRRLYALAARLIRANVGRPRNTTGMPWPPLWVYGAPARRCPRCRGPVSHARQGRDRRPTWWCPRCQRLPRDSHAHGS